MNYGRAASYLCRQSTILPIEPGPVAAVHHCSPPRLIVQIPAQGRPETLVERDRWHEAEFPLYFARVDRVPTIVSRAIRDEANQGIAGLAVGRRAGRESPGKVR